MAEPRCGSGRGRRATRTPAGGGGSEGVRPGFSSCVGSAMKVFAGKQPRLKSDDSSDLLGFGWSDRLASPAPPPSPATYSLSRETLALRNYGFWISMPGDKGGGGAGSEACICLRNHLRSPRMNGACGAAAIDHCRFSFVGWRHCRSWRRGWLLLAC